mgnify:FL=1
MSSGVLWQSDVPLQSLNTFGVKALARRFCRASSEAELKAAAADCRDRGEVPLILGGGSNLLIVADLEVPVIQPQLRGMSVNALNHELSEVEVAAAEPWDAVVRFACEHRLWGIENLALIPGAAGAAPVQNIGAYGVELKDSLAWVDALDLHDGCVQRMGAERLALAYRDSRFKQEPGRWVILRLGLHLRSVARPRLDYAGLREALGEPVALTPEDIAEAVRGIRRRKLPDPAVLGNAGSFFKNPEVAWTRAEALRGEFADLPLFPGSRAGLSKLSAAWLIERAGFKGYRRGDAGISAQHALVLVNHGEASGQELLALAREVAAGVDARFGVRLEPEPIVLGADFRSQV